MYAVIELYADYPNGVAKDILSEVLSFGFIDIKDAEKARSNVLTAFPETNPQNVMVVGYSL